MSIGHVPGLDRIDHQHRYFSREEFLREMQGYFSLAQVDLVESPGCLHILVAGEAMQQEIYQAADRARDLLPAGVGRIFVHLDDAKDAHALSAAFTLGGKDAFFALLRRGRKGMRILRF